MNSDLFSLFALLTGFIFGYVYKLASTKCTSNITLQEQTAQCILHHGHKSNHKNGSVSWSTEEGNL